MRFNAFKIFTLFLFLVTSGTLAEQFIIEEKIFIQTNNSPKKSYTKRQKVNSNISNHQSITYTSKQLGISSEGLNSNISSYQSITYTFKQFGILSEDLVLKEVYPSWSFYIPVYPGYKGGKINLLLEAWGLGKDSYVRIYVDDIPYVSFKGNELPPAVTINLPAYQNKDFIKITIGGFLGLLR